MKIKSVLTVAAAILVCFLLGCTAAGALYLYDRHFDAPAPLTGGQTIDFSAYGFTLTVPDSYALNDYTTNNFAEGGDALFAGCAYGEEQELYIYCYQNEAGDNISDYPETELMSYYMTAGADDVRTRELGSRRFICYSVSVQTQDGYETWDTYETWDQDIHLVFETRMASSNALAILQTIDFTVNVPAQ